MPEKPNIERNIQQIRQKIADYCHKYRRSAEDIQLLAVSKTKSVELVTEAYNSGQQAFGESYLQEALDKMAQLQNFNIQWHFIGHIQSNKTRDIASHFDWVHSVDRYKIAQRLNDQRPPEHPPLNICLQVNINRESGKSGTDIEQLEPLVQQISQLKRLNLRGLMAIPVKTSSLDQQRQNFKKIRQALEQLQQKHPNLDTLSMGMSNDMEAAIAEGSTMLRIGTAIFGSRDHT
ncbi:MAG: YggS family pyridoxal phosphate-dependent enzyme [Gammaproteobacteria bacterium]